MRDYSGKRFGRLVVLGFSKKENGRYFWKCRCDCGETKDVCIRELITGKTKSCGCLRRENPNRIKINNLSGSRIHKIYHNMKTRCLNKNNERYKDYGKRGIKICKEWLGKYTGFLNFYKWAVASGYKDTLTLDRIDNNLGYSPKNCRWATYKEQGRNTRRNINVTINEETHCLKDWCCIYGIKESGVLKYAKRNNVSAKDSLLRRLNKIENETGVDVKGE